MSRFAIVTALVGGLFPLVSQANVVADEPALRRSLLRLPQESGRSVEVTLPTGATTSSRFRVRDSGTLPPVLAKKFPGMRSFRGSDAQGRTVRLDLSKSGMRASVRDGNAEWMLRPGEVASTSNVAPGDASAAPADALATAHAQGLPARMTMARGGGGIRYDFRLAVAADSRYAAKFGGTVEGALGEIVHAVNRANEVFETDVGVHFTLVDDNDRIIRADPRRDPYRRMDPGPATVQLIDREIGKRNYDIGHAVTTLFGGESHIGTSCSDDRRADFFATHKAAAWSGHAHPESEPYAIGFMIHVLGRQLGAWPTANGCSRPTLPDRAVEPGSGSTAMGYAPSGCGGDAQALQARSDLYFHATNIEQMQAWLGSRGGRCASKRINPVSAPWFDPEPFAEEKVIPARTPFVLEGSAEQEAGGRHLTYTWEQMDVGDEQRGALTDKGYGPLFRSFAPTLSGSRSFPRMAAVLGHETAEPGETLPTTSRLLDFRLTVRDNGGEHATVASADTRLRVVDNGRPFAVLSPDAAVRGVGGHALHVRWDVAGTTEKPISCHFLEIDLSIDGGNTWLATPLATDVRNSGEAEVMLPTLATPTDHARMRLRCDWRPFFAVSPGDFTIVPDP
ncbi:reprolysin-like metallo-peptidase family M12B [Luteibacter sp. OK325]|uniref:reprolysin-like metallopeptidase n=1 Tax=Luteibacter sp. OK325 TaxID=2135670 RepID=UPI000D399C47|nr:zinc-dependent metalloprotease family protein [Luteibacter sp. OK325]PTR35156.1 reprolysin-like metallo-peptidase family M12B [Luteibacter sp. OK325]